LGEVFVTPSDRVEVSIGGSVRYEGTAEGYMGKTALKKMGLS
jgi:hypothetical protein